MLKLFLAFLALVLIAAITGGLYMTGQSYRLANRVVSYAPYEFNEAITEFHRSMFIADMHADTFTFVKTFMERKDYAHLDYHRAREGGLSLLTMAIATEVPIAMVRRTGNGVERGGNLIQLGSIGGLEPVGNWYSLHRRGNWVIDNVQDVVAENPDRLVLVTHREDVDKLIDDDEKGGALIGLMLAIEGAHLLEGDLQKLEKFHARGVRMISLTHAFDNEYGGSSEGVEQYGITPAGEQLLERAAELGMIVDVAHASPALVADILDRAITPVVYSHGGIEGTCDIDRNLPDSMLEAIRDNGGLVAIGFWDSVLCGESMADIARAMRYVADRIGAEHVALGSDYDGGVRTTTDASGLPLLTDALFDAGFSDREIRQIMGENYAKLLQRSLPTRLR